MNRISSETETVRKLCMYVLIYPFSMWKMQLYHFWIMKSGLFSSQIVCGRDLFLLNGM